jgi:hypothetical protein
MILDLFNLLLIPKGRVSVTVVDSQNVPKLLVHLGRIQCGKFTP